MATTSRNVGFEQLKKWLGEIFKVQLLEDSASPMFEELFCNAYRAPDGIGKALWIAERFPVVASIWEPQASGKLIKTIFQALEEYGERPLFFVCSDSTMVGRASLFLIRVEELDAENVSAEAAADWIQECATNSFAKNQLRSMLVTTKGHLKYGEPTFVSLAAVQLKSFEN